MFVELINNNGKILKNLTTGTTLDLCNDSLSHFGFNSTHYLVKNNKFKAEALYLKIRNQWVGDEYVEVINE